MSERYTREQFEKYVAAQEERRAEEKRARKERVEKAAAKREYLASGGTASGFEDAWPEIREEKHRRRAVSADERAREVMRSSGVSRI